MRRILWAVIVILALAVLAFIANVLRSRASGAPRFVAGTPASIPPFKQDYYNFLGDRPFENDTMWLWTRSGRNPHMYRYDLRRSVVTGELFNGELPEMSNRDGSRVLVMGIGRTGSSFRDVIYKLFKLPPRYRSDTFWVLDTGRGTVRKIGMLAQYNGAGSTWHSSPDFRYGFNQPSTSMGDSIILCDLEKESLRRIRVQGYPVGWWDEHEILMDIGTNQFDLLDINGSRTHPLFTSVDFQNALAENSSMTLAAATNWNDFSNVLTSTVEGSRPTSFGSFASWNGSNYDFYFGFRDQIGGLQGTNSVLLKTSSANPHLSLVYPRFEFHWGGHLDSSGDFYLYPGESGKPGSSGDGSVRLRNLTNGLVTALVPSVTNGVYTNPRFYKNEVIYWSWKNSGIHRVGLDGSNDVLLLRSDAKGTTGVAGGN